MKKISDETKAKILRLHNKYPSESIAKVARNCGVSKSYAFSFIKKEKEKIIVLK